MIYFKSFTLKFIRSYNVMGIRSMSRCLGGRHVMIGSPRTIWAMLMVEFVHPFLRVMCVCVSVDQ